MKFEEDVLGVEYGTPRRAVVRIGQPIDVGEHLRAVGKPRLAVPALTSELERRIQALLDEIGPGRPLTSGPVPGVEKPRTVSSLPPRPHGERSAEGRVRGFHFGTASYQGGKPWEPPSATKTSREPALNLLGQDQVFIAPGQRPEVAGVMARPVLLLAPEDGAESHAPGRISLKQAFVEPARPTPWSTSLPTDSVELATPLGTHG
jgi:hypothetical protein